MVKRMLACLLTAALLMAMPLSALAAHPYDVNQSGGVTAEDALLLLQHTTGKIDLGLENVHKLDPLVAYCIATGWDSSTTTVDRLYNETPSDETVWVMADYQMIEGKAGETVSLPVYIEAEESPIKLFNIQELIYDHTLLQFTGVVTAEDAASRPWCVTNNDRIQIMYTGSAALSEVVELQFTLLQDFTGETMATVEFEGVSAVINDSGFQEAVIETEAGAISMATLEDLELTILLGEMLANSEQFTDDSIAPLIAALEEAQAVAEDPDATAGDILTAIAAINTAAEGLVEREQTPEDALAELQMLLNEANRLLAMEAVWSESSYGQLQMSVTGAEMCLNDDQPTLEDLQIWISTLDEAILALELVGDYGDVDGNGTVDASDALLALQAATGKVALNWAQWMLADVDNDENGEVTAADALFILQYATRKIGRFPIQGTAPDLQGAEIVIAGMEDSLFAPDDTGDAWAERVAEELEALALELNCTFTFVPYDSSSLTGECIAAEEDGTKFCDILVTNIWQQRSLMEAGALTDLNEVEGLDLTQSYWDQNALDSMELYGKNFIAFSALDGPTANPNVLYFNKTLAKQAFDKLGGSYAVATPEAAAEKLYQMVEDGTWTFDEMIDLSQAAQADLTGDGKMEWTTPVDQYGFSGVNIRNNAAYSLFKSKGGYFTRKDSSGNTVYALDDAINITAMKTIQTWLLEDTSIFNTDKYSNSITLGADAFAEGRVLFLGWTADNAAYFADMKDDWGILPYPKNTAEDAYASAVDWSTQGFSIPRQVTGDDLQNAAIVLEHLAQRLEALSAEKDAVMAESLYRDADTARMLQVAGSSVTVDFVQFGNLGSGGMYTIHYLFDSVNNDPATRVRDVRESSVQTLNDFLAAVK